MDSSTSINKHIKMTKEIAKRFIQENQVVLNCFDGMKAETNIFKVNGNLCQRAELFFMIVDYIGKDVKQKEIEEILYQITKTAEITSR